MFRWTQEARDCIERYAATLKDAELAAMLTTKTGETITVDALRKQRRAMGLRKKHGRGVCGIA